MSDDAQRRFHVLLVEDSAADAELVREALQDVGSEARLTVASDADRAVQKLEDAADRPDLVLLDLRLPGRSGFHVLDHIKSTATLRSIPVVVLSSSGAARDVDRAYSGHANTYLRKPGDFDELVGMMATVDDYWRKRAELPFSD